MRVRRAMAAAATTVLVAGFGIAGAAPASANRVWYQSVGRASAEAACPTSEPADLAAGWSEWAGSWAEWPNDGKGGYVCNRSITWAKDTPPPVAGLPTPDVPSINCVGGFGEYLIFNGGYSLPVGSTFYEDEACTSVLGPAVWDLVYAPAPFDASTLCIAAFGTDQDLNYFVSDVWGCKLYN